MNNDIAYWRSEYENLRRKKNKEIQELKYRIALNSHKTYDLLKLLGLSDNEILNYYGDKDRED